MAFAVKQEAGAEAQALAPIERQIGLENLLLIDKRTIPQAATDHGGHPEAIRTLVPVGQIDPVTTLLRIVWIERHIQEPSLTSIDRRCVAYGLRQQSAFLNEAKAAWPLRH